MAKSGFMPAWMKIPSSDVMKIILLEFLFLFFYSFDRKAMEIKN
jgi:hypothetical protein